MEGLDRLALYSCARRTDLARYLSYSALYRYVRTLRSLPVRYVSLISRLQTTVDVPQDHTAAASSLTLVNVGFRRLMGSVSRGNELIPQNTGPAAGHGVICESGTCIASRALMRHR